MFQKLRLRLRGGENKEKKGEPMAEAPAALSFSSFANFFFFGVIFPTAETVHGLNASLIPPYVPLYQMYMRTEWFCVYPLIFLFFISLVNYVYSLFHANPTRMPLIFVRPRRTLMRRKCNLVPRVLSLPPSRKYPGFGWSRGTQNLGANKNVLQGSSRGSKV